MKSSVVVQTNTDRLQLFSFSYLTGWGLSKLKICIISFNLFDDVENENQFKSFIYDHEILNLHFVLKPTRTVKIHITVLAELEKHWNKCFSALRFLGFLS